MGVCCNFSSQDSLKNCWSFDRVGAHPTTPTNKSRVALALLTNETMMPFPSSLDLNKS